MRPHSTIYYSNCFLALLEAYPIRPICVCAYELECCSRIGCTDCCILLPIHLLSSPLLFPIIHYFPVTTSFLSSTPLPFSPIQLILCKQYPLSNPRFLSCSTTHPFSHTHPLHYSPRLLNAYSVMTYSSPESSFSFSSSSSCLSLHLPLFFLPSHSLPFALPLPPTLPY